MKYNILNNTDSTHGNGGNTQQCDEISSNVTSQFHHIIKSIKKSVNIITHDISNQFRHSIDSLKTCPKELYVNFALKFCESYNYFAISQILVIYLHQEFGLSDMAAGGAYGLWGAAITFWGLISSCLNDTLGVRRSLLIGFSISCISTLMLAVTTSKTHLFIILFAIYPIGTSMGIPMLTVGIRRYTNASNRGFAYGLYYAVMNVAAFVSGPIVDIFNIYLPDGMIIAGRRYSGNRMVIMTASMICLCSLILTYTSLREIRVSDSETIISSHDNDANVDNAVHNVIVDHHHGDVIDGDKIEMVSISRESSAESVDSYSPLQHVSSSSPSPSSSPSSSSSIISLLQNRTFYRFMMFSLFLINLNAVFRHLDATLPTYLIRTYGPDIPKGIIYSINPMIIILITPVIAAYTSSYKHYDMIKYGGYISSLSPFFLAVSSSLWATISFVMMLSFGEAIWSPRVYDYTMSISPEGKEASFAALSSAPLFAAKVPVGLMSGYLVSTYLPEHGRQRGKMMWFIIGCMTMTSPICITLFERCIREPERHRAKMIVDDDGDMKHDVDDDDKDGNMMDDDDIEKNRIGYDDVMMRDDDLTSDDHDIDDHIDKKSG